MKLTEDKLDLFRNSFESISLLSGEAFFKELVAKIGTLLDADSIWVTEYHKEQNSMTTKSFWHSGRYMDNFTYLIQGAPCERAIKSPDLVHYSNRIRDHFPSNHKMLAKFNGEQS